MDVNRGARINTSEGARVEEREPGDWARSRSVFHSTKAAGSGAHDVASVFPQTDVPIREGIVVGLPGTVKKLARLRYRI